jgi:acyl transferase domain-containing protein
MRPMYSSPGKAIASVTYVCGIQCVMVLAVQAMEASGADAQMCSNNCRCPDAFAEAVDDIQSDVKHELCVFSPHLILTFERS